MRNPYKKFQNSSMHGSKVMLYIKKRDERMDERTNTPEAFAPSTSSKLGHTYKLRHGKSCLQLRVFLFYYHNFTYAASLDAVVLERKFQFHRHGKWCFFEGAFQCHNYSHYVCRVKGSVIFLKGHLSFITAVLIYEPCHVKPCRFLRAFQCHHYNLYLCRVMGN